MHTSVQMLVYCYPLKVPGERSTPHPHAFLRTSALLHLSHSVFALALGPDPSSQDFKAPF